MTKDYKQPAAGARHALLPGIVIGVVIGLAVAIGVVIFVRKTPDAFVDRGARAVDSDARAVVTQPIPPAASTTPSPPVPGGDKPRFDFYNILPGNEDPVVKDAEPVPPDPEVPVKQEQFYLQLGSFQSETEADNLKAKLALLGVEARIETANVADKGVFHRVRVGPYAGTEELKKVRDQLNQNGVSSSLVKVDQAP